MVELSGMVSELAAKLREWLEGAVLMLPNLMVALLIVLGFWIVSRLVRRTLDRVLARVTSNVEVRRLLVKFAAGAVLAVGLFISLGVLQLDKTVTSLLGAAGVLGIIAGLAFQDLAANFFAGILMSIRQPFRTGQLIETNGHYGIAERINFRATELRLLDGRLALVPNKDVFQTTIINYSENSVRRVEVPVGVSYGDDLEAARRVTIEAVEAVEPRDRSKPVELFYQSFGDSSVNFVVRFWVPFARETDYLQARSAAIMNIHRAYDRHGITIPFPIRTLDFGIVGGEKLSDVLPPSLYADKGR
jgi:small conductance mechanosensitive channel